MGFQDIFAERMQLDEALFYIDKEVALAKGLVSVVKRQSLYGLQYGTEDALPTVFDNARFVTDDVIELQIEGLLGLYSARNSEWLFEPNQCRLSLVDEFNTVEVEAENGMGLFSIREGRVVVTPQFDETTDSDIGEYLWVRRGNKFHFINKESQVFYSASDAIMAYDTDEGMWVKHSNGTVSLLNKAGNDDIKAFRKALIDNIGRMKLQNLKYGIIDICDIYGRVLN